MRNLNGKEGITNTCYLFRWKCEDSNELPAVVKTTGYHFHKEMTLWWPCDTVINDVGQQENLIEYYSPALMQLLPLIDNSLQPAALSVSSLPTNLCQVNVGSLRAAVFTLCQQDLARAREAWQPSSDGLGVGPQYLSLGTDLCTVWTKRKVLDVGSKTLDVRCELLDDVRRRMPLCCIVTGCNLAKTQFICKTFNQRQKSECIFIIDLLSRCSWVNKTDLENCK